MVAGKEFWYIKIVNKPIKYFGFIFWMHLALVLVAYSSPFLFDWRIIIVGVVVLFVQYVLVGGCVLNKVQFGSAKDVTFLYPYLKMVGVKLDPHKFKFFIRYVLPFALLLIAFLWQVVWGRSPLLF